MVTIVGIAGSLRRQSFNAQLLLAAQRRMPEGSRLELGSIRDVPLYDGDAEAASGQPAAVQALKERIAAADGLLLATPEYNNSIPGVLKNAIDWLSRPPADIPRVFGDKPVAVIGATPGAGGTRLAQAALLSVLRALGTALWSGRQLYVAQAAKVFDAEGELVDGKVDELLRKLLLEFVATVQRR